MISSGFTGAELWPYIGLFLLILYIFISNYVKGPRQFWSPMTVICLVFGYYCLLGPYHAISTGKTIDRLLNMRPFYPSAFWGALLCVGSCFAGFSFNNKKGTAINYEMPDHFLSYYGKWMYMVGFILFTISTGGNVAKLLNPFAAEAVETVGGGLANYLSLSINFLIPGVTLLFAYYLRTKKGLAWFLICAIVATGLFTTLGFRFRIVLLLLSLAITYHLLLGKKLNLLLAGLGIFVFITMMGIIDKTREYGSGLSLDRLQKKTEQSNYESGLNEAKIFQTSGAIIDHVPSRIPYVGFTPIISTLLFPIPRAIYKSKDSGDYLFNAINTIYGKKVSKGAAFLMYAEHYLAFGWIGILLGGFLIGWFFKNSWAWYLANSTKPFVVVTYAVTASFLYVIISRGYMPLVTMLFFFTVFPMHVALKLIKRKSSIAFKKTTANYAK